MATALVIDDDAHIRCLVAMTLKRAGRQPPERCRPAQEAGSSSEAR
jgi:hypothetical protein